MFQKLDLFPSSGERKETHTLLGPSEIDKQFSGKRDVIKRSGLNRLVVVFSESYINERLTIASIAQFQECINN
jgi:hypothetical protein